MRGALLAAVTLIVCTVPVGDALGASPARRVPGPNGHGYSRLRDGESRRQVLALLGSSYSICPACAPQTLIYRTGLDDPIAIVVRFRHGTLASHFLVRPTSDV